MTGLRYLKHGRSTEQNLTLFDNIWLQRVRAKNMKRSWSKDVVETIEAGGSVYLNTLRLWFEIFPLPKEQKRRLRVQLESTKNEDHLGAVNELVWWQFMQHIGLKSIPLPTAISPRPDFKVESPFDFFAEVSTINVSENDKGTFEAGEAVVLNDEETLRRILRKINSDKQDQISYAVDQKKPFALVLFDYTIWSMFGTQFFYFLGNYLLGTGFKGLSAGLSAIIYVERRVLKGRIGISKNRSAIYHSPSAKYPLHMGLFDVLNQFSQCRAGMVESNFSDHWIWL